MVSLTRHLHSSPRQNVLAMEVSKNAYVLGRLISAPLYMLYVCFILYQMKVYYMRTTVVFPLHGSEFCNATSRWPEEPLHHARKAEQCPCTSRGTEQSAGPIRSKIFILSSADLVKEDLVQMRKTGGENRWHQSCQDRAICSKTQSKGPPS
jgi:hypothetical protein